MEHGPWPRIRATFNEIVGLPEAERSARLEQIGETDPRMRSMLEALMRGNAMANAVQSPRERVAFTPTHEAMPKRPTNDVSERPPAQPVEQHPAEQPPDTREVKRLLEPSAPQTSTPQRSASRRVLLETGGLGLSVLVIVLGAFALRRDMATTAPTWLDVDAPDSASAHSFGLNSISLSPDGSEIAYIGGPKNALFIRSLNDSRGSRKIERSDNARCPSFSPDGKWIVFTTNYQLVKIPSSGGMPASVIDSTVDQCALWIGDKHILFERDASLFAVSSDGGPQSLVARIDTLNDIRELHLSQALPGGKAALVSLVAPNTSSHSELGVLSLTDGKVTRLGKSGVTPRYANGYLLYGSAGLFAVPYSPRGMRVTGPETQLPLRSAQFATSANERMAYIDDGGQGDDFPSIAAVSTDGHARALVAKIDDSSWPRLSPDGKRIALALKGRQQLSWDIWVYDLETQHLTRLTDQPSDLRPMGWSSDSRRVVFLAPDSGTSGPTVRVVRQVWDGTAPPRELIRLPVPATTFTMGVRHGYAAFSVVDARSSRGDIWVVPLDTPSAPRPFVATKASAIEPRMSHDGQMLAYTSNESGRNEVFVRSVAGTAPAIQVSDSGGTQPIWSTDDDALYYRSPSHLMRAALARGQILRITRRDALFDDKYQRTDATDYDVIPGDKELLMIQRNLTGQHVGIVMDWPALLSQQAARRN